MHPSRQRLSYTGANTVPKDPSSEQKLEGPETLAQAGLSGDHEVLFLKDLGPQVGWRTVFILEYLGPLLIYPLFHWGGWMLYSHYTPEKSLTQQLALFLMVFHFAKREVESVMVHRFSSETMPISRIPLNCTHYWVLCGLFISYFVAHPRHQAPFEDPWTNYALAGVMLLFEVLNFGTHLVLRNLR
eukprot:Filipodium_phascolosomae@DN1581_c0_g1_i1.p1